MQNTSTQSPAPAATLPSTLNEALVLVDALRGRILELETLVADLREKLRTGSSNSSKPPSSDPPWKKTGRKVREKSGKQRGGQPGHPGHRRELLPVDEVDEVVPCPLPARCVCGGCLEADPGGPERHQVFELPEVKPRVTEYQVYRGTCTRCRQRAAGTLPAGVPTGTLGPRAMAAVAELTGKYHLSQRETAELFEGQFGIPISPATVAQTEARISEAITEPVDAAREFVKAQAVVQMDETGSKIAGKRAWTWVALAVSVAVFVIRRSRGSEVARDLVGEDFGGTALTDRWSGYFFIPPERRQLCWSHLVRDFTRIEERGGTSGPLGAKLVALSHQMFHHWHQFRDGTLDRDALQEAMRPIQEAVVEALKEGARCGHPKTQRTCANVLKLEAALFNFVTTPGLEPTNNAAERTIRPYVLWRKKSFGTQGDTGTTYVERILTVVATCRAQGRNVLDYLTEAIEAHLHQRSPPSLLPTPPPS